MILLVFPFYIFAQQPITGYILDATTRKPVEGANISTAKRDTIFVSFNRTLFKSDLAAQDYSPGPIPDCAIYPAPPGRSGEGLPSSLRISNPEYANMSDKDIMQSESLKIPRKTEKDVGSELTRASR